MVMLFLALFLSFNSSILTSFSAPNPPNPSPSTPSSPSSITFLKEVLHAVAAKEWDPEANPRVSAVDIDSVRVRAIQSFEFHVRVGGAKLIMKFSEETEAWRKADKGEVELGLDLVAFDVGYKQGIEALSLEGPLELLAYGDDDELSVHLPSVNRGCFLEIHVDAGSSWASFGKEDTTCSQWMQRFINFMGKQAANLNLNESIRIYNG